MYRSFLGVDQLTRVSPGVYYLQNEVKGYSVQIQRLSMKVREQDEEICAVRKEVKLLLLELGQTRQSINGITKQLKTLYKKYIYNVSTNYQITLRYVLS